MSSASLWGISSPTPQLTPSLGPAGRFPSSNNVAPFYGILNATTSNLQNKFCVTPTGSFLKNWRRDLDEPTFMWKTAIKMGSHNELVVVGLNEQLLCSAYYVGCQRDDAALAAERRRLQLSTDISFPQCKKVKFSHTRYRALGPELIPVYRQSARR